LIFLIFCQLLDTSAPLRFKDFCCVLHLRLRGDILRAVNQQHQSGVAKGPAILLLLAVVIFAAGAVRYYRHGNFSLTQAGYCVGAVVGSLVVLLIFDYTLHHAKIVAVMVLIFVVLFLVASPAFCVGMGLGLAGMVLAQGEDEAKTYH
jgi:glucan phosphoethanolaminetransferase (alkaline phosphatase superfamily)